MRASRASWLSSRMNLENLISEALCHPPNYIPYYVSRRLAELYSEKAIIEGGGDAFGLELFVRSGQCSLIADTSIHHQVKSEWQGLGEELSHQAENGWFNVLWRDCLIDVLFISYIDDGYRSRQHWILADTKEVAEGFLRAVCAWNAEVRGEVLVYDGGCWSKSEELYLAIKAASFDNLVLAGGLKDEIQSDFARFFESREVYERYAIPWKRGVLLIGPPGNGKTHTVKALINQLNRPCLYVKSFKSHYGTEHDNIRAVFARARQTTPCIVVFEDLDSLIDDKNRAFFLNEMDGFASNTGVVVLASTNYPERLDPAILDRPSRFDRKYYFNPPAAPERLAYIRNWSDALDADLKVAEDAMPRIVELTEGFSFAYLKEMFLSSMMQWVSNPVAGRMACCLIDRASALRDQMSSLAEQVNVAAADDDD
jgi:hypothetical protein